MDAQRDEQPLLVLGVLREIRIERAHGIGLLARQRLHGAEPQPNLVVVGPQLRGFDEDVERRIGVAQPNECIAQQRVDERRIALRDEGRLPRAHRLAVATAGRIARAEVERGGKELGVEPERLAELVRGGPSRSPFA